MAQQSYLGSIASSITAGAAGFVRGAISLGVILGGIGFGVGLITSGGVLPAALTASAAGAFTGAHLGGLVGALTGMMQHREKTAPDAQDILNVANISFAQGVSTGLNKSISQHSKQEVLSTADHFQKQLAAEKNGTLVAAR